MKIGAEPATDVERVRAAREAIGPSTNLFVDANGAYNARQAIAVCEDSLRITMLHGLKSLSAPTFGLELRAAIR